MSRYINAEWLLNFFEPYPNDYQTPLGLLRACVDDASTIDAVEVVRCKECKYYETDECPMVYYSPLEDDVYDMRWWNKADDYCSWGKRSE